ncbi:argininosuccinate synthase, partial [Salmonella sp. zj-f54]|nr:argininosuccinate synthase [Salmonella sp. zj-f54]
CDQVKVTTVCSGYGTPNYPIKEPLNMKEPASCPVK